MVSSMSNRRITVPHAALANALRSYDDRPDVERYASPSDLVLRQTSGVPR
jgi:hypothetical protein